MTLPVDSPIVETRGGRLLGTREHGVFVFRGVPYARPPVGALRFAAPEPPPPWSGVRAASRFAPVAPQQGVEVGLIGGLLSLVRGGISEDCLYLNVWTAGLDDGRRPVLVFLHGGAFVLGAGSTFPYSGIRFARGGAVLVSLNYRLGALGFLDLGRVVGDDGPPANLGIRDQIVALSWVRDNIRAFGGDPDNVTLYGESAGAMSVGTHLGIDGPRDFRRAVMSSGAAANVSTPDQAEYASRRFLEALSVRPGDWRRLRELPLKNILRAQRSVFHGDLTRLGRLPWQPSVDGDLIRRPPLEAIRGGSASDVAVLVGTNREEWKLFTLLGLHLRWMGEGSFLRRARRLLEQSGVDPGVADELIEIHDPKRGGARRRRYESWIAIRSEQLFLLPAIELAEAHAARGGSAYVYRFDFPAPRWPRWVGSCHGLELGTVFGSYRHPLFRPLYGRGEPVTRLAAELNSIWLEFAVRGIPSWPDGPTWSRFDGVNRAMMVLDSPSHPAAAPELAHRSLWSARPAQTER